MSDVHWVWRPDLLDRLPFRPKDRYVQRYDRYEDILDQGIIPLIAKFLGRSG
jgi:hypothetical protein